MARVERVDEVLARQRTPLAANRLGGADLDQDAELLVDLVEHTGFGQLAAALGIGRPEHDHEATVLPEEVEQVADEEPT